MIRTSPGSIGHRALTLLAQTPGMTSDEIAAELFPVRLARPAYDVRDTAAVRAWREEFAAAEKASRAKASRLIGRLQEMGLIETRGAPRLAEGFVREVAATMERLLVEWPHLLESLDGPAVLSPEEADRRAVLKWLRQRTSPREALTWHARIVAALRVESPPKSARALFESLPAEERAPKKGKRKSAMAKLHAARVQVATEAGAPKPKRSASAGGAANLAYRRLDEIGAIVPPSQRWLTPKGVALLEGRKEAA